jgi:hypothetical protein
MSVGLAAQLLAANAKEREKERERERERDVIA